MLGVPSGTVSLGTGRMWQASANPQCGQESVRSKASVPSPQALGSLLVDPKQRKQLMPWDRDPDIQATVISDDSLIVSLQIQGFI
jgi:hypothetical protein